MLFRQEKSTLKGPENRNFYKGVKSMGLAETGHFSHLMFYGKSCQERSLFDILDRNECFLEKKSNF